MLVVERVARAGLFYDASREMISSILVIIGMPNWCHRKKFRIWVQFAFYWSHNEQCEISSGINHKKYHKNLVSCIHDTALKSCEMSFLVSSSHCCSEKLINE